MGSGRPLFVSDRPPMPDFAEDAAIYFNPEVPEDLAQKLVKYLDDQPYLQSLGAKAAQLAENYSWEETSRRTFEAILRVAKR
jgi:glycosyltransferase involved in cell wall biosynthesis